MWLSVLSTTGVDHEGPWQIKSASFFLSLSSLLSLNKTRHSRNSLFTDYFTDQSGACRQEKGADRVSPQLQQGGQGLCTSDRSASPWTGWTYWLQATSKLWMGDLHSPTTVKSRIVLIWSWLCAFTAVESVSREHLIFSNQFNSPSSDRRNMLPSCCAAFKAMLPW